MLTSSEWVMGSSTLLIPDLYLNSLNSTVFFNPGSFIPGNTSTSSAKNGEKTLGTPVQMPPFCGPHSWTASTAFIYFFFLLPRLWGHLPIVYFYHPATLLPRHTKAPLLHFKKKNKPKTKTHQSPSSLHLSLRSLLSTQTRFTFIWLFSPNWTCSER